MSIFHFDVKSAFLNGDLKEVIFMKQPPGFEEGDKLVCKLKKSIYGLKQAAHVWNNKLHEVIYSGGYKQSDADPCLYTKYTNEKGLVYILVYVDDILVASQKEKPIRDVEKLLSQKFEINCLGKASHYLGIEIFQDKNLNYCIRQSSYIKNLVKEFGLEDSKISQYPLNPGYGKAESENLLNNDQYQKLTGSLLYLSVYSRPDIAASVSILARKVSCPTLEDWTELKRVLKYLKGTQEYFLRMSCQHVNPDILTGYADANWAEDRLDRKSNSGYIFQINGGTISWSCRKQTLVALSSTEAEFISLSETCKEAICIKQLLDDMHISQNFPIVIYEDNQSCLHMIKDQKLSGRTKHIDTKIHFLNDHIDKGDVKCLCCPSNEMLADVMTKPLQNPNLLSYDLYWEWNPIEEGCGRTIIFHFTKHYYLYFVV